MRTIRIVLSLIVVLGSAGCLTDGARKESPAGAQYPPERYLSAVGLGQSEGEARARAVAELSRIFESRVRSDTLDRVKLVVRSAGEESLEQEMDSRVRVISNVELKGLEVARTWQEKGTHYALAILERAKAAENWLNEVAGIDGKIEGRLDALGSTGGKLLRYRSLKAVTDLWLQRQVLQSRLTVLGYKAPAPQAYDMKQVFRSVSELKAHMPVYLDIRGEGAETVREHVAGALGQAGFAVAEDPDEAAVLVRGEVTVEPVDIEHPDWVYARASVSLSVFDIEADVSIAEVSGKRRATHLTYAEAAGRALRNVLPRVAGRLIDSLEQEHGVGN